MALMLIGGCRDDRQIHNFGLYHDSEAVFFGYLLLMAATATLITVIVHLYKSYRIRRLCDPRKDHYR